MDQILASVISVITQLIAAVPVVLTMVAIQTIKIFDKKKVAKNHYFLISVAVGLAIGAGFSAGLSAAPDFFLMGRDAFQTSMMATFLYGVKTAMKAKWPGDSGYGKKEV